jgi:hypothetical protein
MEKSIKYFIASLVFLTAIFFISSSGITATPEEEAIQVMENFAKAIGTKNSELLSSLYWHSPKTTYFAPSKDGAFLTQGWLEGGPGVDISLSLHHPQATILSDNVAVLTGYHTAVVTDPETKQQSTDLIRQTLVVQKIGGKWLIVHEHASFLPTK